MSPRKYLLAAALIGLLGAPLLAQARDGDWKRGHVYYLKVCTECHVNKPCGTIGPNSRTKAEWNAYLQADKHANGKESLKYYWSAAYRESVKATNQAAKKFLMVPEQDLQDDLRAFVLRSAKDGDAPTGCR
jgi:hypothetical protein